MPPSPPAAISSTREAVEADQPVGLVEPVLAHERRRLHRQRRARLGDRAERRIVDATEADSRRRAERSPRAPPRRRCRRRRRSPACSGRPGRSGVARPWPRRSARASGPSRRGSSAARFSGARRARLELGRQLDVDRQPVGPEAGLLDQPGARLGDRLEVDVAGEAMVAAQGAGDADQLLHRVVGRADDAGGEEQALDVVALVEFERQPSRPPRRVKRARGGVRGAAVDAIGAVVEAPIRQQDLQERHAAAVGRVGVADAGAGGRAEPARRRPCAWPAPDEAQEASYFAASARMRSLAESFGSMPHVLHMFLRDASRKCTADRCRDRTRA